MIGHAYGPQPTTIGRANSKLSARLRLVSLNRTQIDKLGERLRKHEATDADLNMLREVLTEHDGELETVVVTLRTLRGRNGELLAPTQRVKTTATLIGKLVRDKTRLSSVHDIAGAPVVVGETLDEQDEQVGRQIRYGREPDSDLRFRTASQVVQLMKDLSAQVAEIENIRQTVRAQKRENFDPRHRQQGVLSEDEMLQATMAYEDEMEMLQSMEEHLVALGEALASRLGTIRDMMAGS